MIEDCGKMKTSFPSTLRLVRSRRFTAVLVVVLVLTLLSALNPSFVLRNLYRHSDPTYPELENKAYAADIDMPSIEDNFPGIDSGKPLPQILALNKAAAADSTRFHTPMFIGFTRSWPQLQQTVVGYLTAGWPAAEVFVVDNTGTMDSNAKGRLSLQNPSYISYNRLQSLGVNIIRTPTLLTFSQLQNFFISEAISRNWTYYFWSHQDVLPLTEEHLKPYKSFYAKVQECMQDIKEDERWAVRFFAFDWLTLVNIHAMNEVGGWDTQIPFYNTDCDMYGRLAMLKYSAEACRAGLIYDLAQPLDDLNVLYPETPDEKPNSLRYKLLVKKLYLMQKAKEDNKIGRNTWQLAQSGGRGEPYYRDPSGFEYALQMWVDHGRTVFYEKWRHGDCDIIGAGRSVDDAWQV